MIRKNVSLAPPLVVILLAGRDKKYVGKRRIFRNGGTTVTRIRSSLSNLWNEAGKVMMVLLFSLEKNCLKNKQFVLCLWQMVAVVVLYINRW